MFVLKKKKEMSLSDASSTWCPGTLCLAEWTDGNLYTAKIIQPLDDLFLIVFSEFNERDKLPFDKLHPHPDADAIGMLMEGDLCQASWTDGNFYPAAIKQVLVRGIRFVVEFVGFNEIFTVDSDQIRPHLNSSRIKSDPPKVSSLALEQESEIQPPAKSSSPEALFIKRISHCTPRPPVSLEIQEEVKEVEVDPYAGLSPDQVKKLQKGKKKAKIIEEIVESEHFYVSALQVVLDLWLKPLKESFKNETASDNSGDEDNTTNGVILPEKFVKLIFSNIEVIFALQQRFYEELQSVQNGDRTIGQVFSRCKITFYFHHILIDC